VLGFRKLERMWGEDEAEFGSVGIRVLSCKIRYFYMWVGLGFSCKSSS
jgi:hypothetical protein